MPKKKLGPMNVYPHLPRTNCGLCPPRTCMGFAVQLCERGLTLADCPPLDEAEHEGRKTKLEEILAPPVREVTFGTGTRIVRIGGDLVLRRHELRYFNPTAIATVADDTMRDAEITELVTATSSFSYPYIGQTLTLDAIAVRAVSGDPERFREAVTIVARATGLPLILWSEEPRLIEAVLPLVADRRPLLYAANWQNWREMGKLALQSQCPLVVYSPEGVERVRALTHALFGMGIRDLVIDPGCGVQEHLPAMIDTLVQARTAAIEGGDILLGYPLAGTPVRIWESHCADRDENARWLESSLATMMIVRYADIVMIRSPEIWSVLPLVVLRANLYNDPRKPVSVEPGLRTFGRPDAAEAPVLITTNFALTYYTVLGDIEKLDCYLLVADTEGLSVDSAVAGRKLNAEKVADAIRSSGIEQLVTHRTLIIPGLAARLKGDIEDATSWDVIVGPRDSATIPAYIKEKWAGRDHSPGWSYR